MSNDMFMKLVHAIRAENAEEIARLLHEHPEQRNAFTPIAGQTWLGYAAQLGKLESVKALISSGVDLNKGDEHDGDNPISSAAANGHYEIVEYLLRAGAQMDVSLSIRNPLFAAIVGQSSATVRLLLQSGIDSKARYTSETMKDMDAVAFALMRGEAECARIIALWNTNGNDGMADIALAEAHRIAEYNAHM